MLLWRIPMSYGVHIKSWKMSVMSLNWCRKAKSTTLQSPLPQGIAAQTLSIYCKTSASSWERFDKIKTQRRREGEEEEEEQEQEDYQARILLQCYLWWRSSKLPLPLTIWGISTEKKMLLFLHSTLHRFSTSQDSDSTIYKLWRGKVP